MPLCITAVLAGPIIPGDADKFQKLIQENTPFISRLILNSAGGNVAESIRLGQLARKYYITTEVPFLRDSQPTYVLVTKQSYFLSVPSATCVSSCFFVWLGGTTRRGEIVGIHRPYPPDAEMRNLTPSAAGQFYRDWSNRIAFYISEVEAAQHWLPDMLRFGSDEMHMLTTNELTELTGDVPSMAQWKLARCGGISKRENDYLRDNVDDYNNRKLSSNARTYFESLDRKLTTNSQCEHQAVVIARWQVQPQ